MAEITHDLSTERWHYCMAVTWKLRDFFRIPAKVDSLLESSSFSLAEADWQLKLYPNGESLKDNEGFIGIYLRRKDFSVDQQRVKATFSFRTRDGQNYKSCSLDRLYEHNQSRGYSRFIERSELEKKEHTLLPDGTLTLDCHIMVERADNSGVFKEESSQTDSSFEQMETGASHRQHLEASSRTETPDACKGDEDLTKTSACVHRLQSDYKELLESEEDSDVCLKVSDKEFRAHKNILRARSSVFSAMFKHDTEERNSGEVVIEDLDPESFPDFLQHVYSGSVDFLSEENVFNLYIAADKYSMEDLKTECKSYMERTLSVDTFCDVMILALRYKEDELLKVAIDFFCKNLTKIIVTVKWQKFLEEHVTAGNELLIKALVPSTEE